MNVKRALWVLILFVGTATGQQRDYNGRGMTFDVGRINMTMNKVMGDGGLQSQFSWNLTGENRSQTEIFYWPDDRWQSNILYQIFNPLSLDDNGIIDENGVAHAMMSRGLALTNYGMTDWVLETRRFRPPHITVDGFPLDPPYRGVVDPSLPSDIKLEFEDVLSQFGIRSHVEIFGFSDPDQGDYFIWKATHRFTGEIKLPRNSSTPKDTLPDQTIRFWWPIAFSFGPSKAGELNVLGTYAYEGEDDLDSWFARRSELYPDAARESLYVAYYYDWSNPNTSLYSNGSRDDTGDPDRITGYLYSTQVPGYALLHADTSPGNPADDVTQPYAMPHGSIVTDLWGRRDNGLKLTYRGDDGRGRFPLDPITAGLSTVPPKGPMRFITAGPYSLTKNATQGRFDEISLVYAVGVGSIDRHRADSVGHLWITRQISDSAKDAWVLKGRDSLWKVLDRANWTWNRIARNIPVPAAPPPPDVVVRSAPNSILVQWSYPDASYFRDAATGIDDWHAWRVYRKRGALLVDDPLDKKSGAEWVLVFETTDRSVTTFGDSAVTRGVDYYYAVTAVDNGSQNTDGILPGEQLESSRYVTRSALPAVPYKPGLAASDKIRVVPNPATVAAGPGLAFGTPDKISFFNLPFQCTLRIFTETGDMIKRIYHYGTADEEWDQRTDQNQYVASGIYILAATECRDIDRNTLDNAFVKFIIVR